MDKVPDDCLRKAEAGEGAAGARGGTELCRGRDTAARWAGEHQGWRAGSGCGQGQRGLARRPAPRASLGDEGGDEGTAPGQREARCGDSSRRAEEGGGGAAAAGIAGAGALPAPRSEDPYQTGKPQHREDSLGGDLISGPAGEQEWTGHQPLGCEVLGAGRTTEGERAPKYQEGNGTRGLLGKVFPRPANHVVVDRVPPPPFPPLHVLF